MNFNSRPHGGRRRDDPALPLPAISTHALTEGDYNGAGNRNRDDISTHALTEGDSEGIGCHLLLHISTHALTEGDSPESSDNSQ